MIVLRVISACFLIHCTFPVVAQNDTSIKASNSYTAGINYQSRLHYFGRTDSLKSTGVFPTIGFELKEGVYANANFIFVNNPTQSFDYSGTILEAGYKLPTSKHFSGNGFYNQFLYRENSQLVQSALKSQTGINLTWSNKIANFNAGADAKFSDKTDFGVTAGIDHLFIYVIPDTKNAIAVNPSLYGYGGTQHFTQSYYKKRKVPGNGLGLGNLSGGNGNGNGNTKTVIEEINRFSILSYEASLPVVLVIGKFNASLTASYVIPENLVKIANRPDLTENGKNMFYFTAGVGVRL